MAIDTIPLNPFNNVVASGIANVDLSNLFGYSIERLFLQLGGTSFTKAMITGWQLKANGKIIMDSDGTKQDARMLYRGVTTQVDFLTIDFLELSARSDLGLQGGALDTTMGIKNLRLEVTISGATAPTLVGWAEVTRPQIDEQFAALRPLIARIHRTTQTVKTAPESGRIVDYSKNRNIDPLIAYFVQWGNTDSSRAQAYRAGWTSDEISLAVLAMAQANGNL